MQTNRKFRALALAATGIAGACAALADPPPPRRPDPISLDRVSPSVTIFGESTADIFGENPPPVLLGFGWDVGGPGPIDHVLSGNYGLPPLDNTDGISNNELFPQRPQILYFSVALGSRGAPATPVRNQFNRNQAAGDRYVTNGRTALSPVAVLGGGGPSPLLPGGFPPHVISANQTRFNEIPSIPPPAFNGAWIPPDNMDGLEITPIDLTGDLLHDTPIYFTVDAGSSPVAAGFRMADILLSPPGVPAWGLYAPHFTMGLTPDDDIDGLAVWDQQARGSLDPGADVVIFSLRPGSPSLAGPDGIVGTADDFSAADVFVSGFTGFFRLYVTAGALGLLRTDDIDALDVEPALIGAGPQWRDWWVQRVNIDVPYCPPPGPPVPPANDFHVVFQGISPQQLSEPWTGSFPNATISAVPGGAQITWTGASVPQGGVAHFGWTVIDDTQVQAVDMYWTIDGVRVDCRRIPDLVQNWRVDALEGTQVRVVDVLQNRSQDLVFLRRRAVITQQEIELADLMADSELVLNAPFVDTAPIALQPGQTIELPFPYDIRNLGYGVFYETFVQTPTGAVMAANFLTAITVSQSDEADLPTGGCCLEGECLETTRIVCDSNGGQYLGDDIFCLPGVCGGSVTRCDTNCDGVVDFFDIDAFLLALFNPAGYQAQFPNCNILSADANNDGTIDFFDIDAFLQCLFG